MAVSTKRPTLSLTVTVRDEWSLKRLLEEAPKLIETIEREHEVTVTRTAVTR